MSLPLEAQKRFDEKFTQQNGCPDCNHECDELRSFGGDCVHEDPKDIKSFIASEIELAISKTLDAAEKAVEGTPDGGCLGHAKSNRKEGTECTSCESADTRDDAKELAIVAIRSLRNSLLGKDDKESNPA